jgi:hypothetical protein
MLTKPVRRLPDENATIIPRGNPNKAIIPQFLIGATSVEKATMCRKRGSGELEVCLNSFR